MQPFLVFYKKRLFKKEKNVVVVNGYSIQIISYKVTRYSILLFNTIGIIKWIKGHLSFAKRQKDFRFFGWCRKLIMFDQRYEKVEKGSRNIKWCIKYDTVKNRTHVSSCLSKMQFSKSAQHERWGIQSCKVRDKFVIQFFCH